MRSDIAKRWAGELRSGKYAQGTDVLKSAVAAADSEIEYCCLGVLCEMAVKDRVIPPPVIQDRYRSELGTPGRNTWAFCDGNEEVFSELPQKVLDWAEMLDSSGYLQDPLGTTAGESLSVMNDNGCTFTEIADTIEDNVDKL